MATAKGALAVGGSRSDSLQTSGEQDLFTIGLLAGFNYQFLLAAAAGFSGPGNLGETLIGPNNVAITGGAGTTSIHLTPTTSGTYTLSVAAAGSSTGAYTLNATPQDDYGTLPGQLAVGGNTTGVLEGVGDTDTFTIALVAGFNYQFLLASAAGFSGPGNLGETLIGPNNVAITGGAGTTSIHLTPTTSGTYTLSVAAAGSSTGAYTLNATPQDDYGTLPGKIAVGGNTTGVLESVGDTDTFTIALVAGFNYQFLLAATAGFSGAGNLGETLIGPDNVAITGGAGTTSIHLTPTTSGTYTLSVAAAGSSTGAYTLTATPQDDYGTIPGQLLLSGNTTGVLESIGDTDSFTATLVAGLNYKFSLAAGAGFTNAGNLVETLIGPNNVVVPNSSSQITSGSESSKSISITPATTGNYKLSIAAANGTGSYIITSTTVGPPVYRFFDANYGTHFFTSDVGERNTIIGTRSDLTEETNGFGAVAQNDPNAVAVFRFFDNKYGTHFFTASASERDTIIATRPDLGYEPSSTFYEHMTQQFGDVAVYRLFDQKTGTQFLTGDQGEYNGITTPGAATYRSDLRSEGVAFYAPVGYLLNSPRLTFDMGSLR